MKKKLLALTLAAVMVLGCMSGCGSKAKVYKVGVCQLVQHVALDAATEGFKTALIEKLGEENVQFDVQNAQGDSATCSTIVNQFVANSDDLIMCNATAPLQAAAAATLDIPILGTSVTDYATALDIDNWNGLTGRNISGTSDLAPLSEQAAMLNELFPEATKVGVLYCSAEANSQYQADVIKAELEKLGKTVAFYTFVDTNDVATVVRNAAENSDVLYIPTDNTAASNTETIGNVVKELKVPVIAGEEGICSGCGVATLSISYYDLGYTTGLMAAEVLTGAKNVKDMEVQFAPNVTKKYNAAMCAELGVTVPSDYIAIE